MDSYSRLENDSMKHQHPQLLFGTSNKGKPIIIYNNYFFTCNKTTGSKKYWVCSERACVQNRFGTVKERYIQQQISANELLSSLSLLIGKKKK